MSGVGDGVADNASAAFDLLEGIPTPEHLKGVYWRAQPEVAAADEANIQSRGLIWISPILPTTSEACREVTKLIEQTLESFGFDALMTLSAVTPRAMCCVTSIHFDKAAQEEKTRASRCYEKILEELLSAGFTPYRLGRQSMNKLSRVHQLNAGTLIKQALDEQGIIAPERYV